AELAPRRAASCAPPPGAGGLRDGANPPGHHGTSYHALVDRADLQADETLLVLGAAGGVGLAAVQIGKALGAKVVAAVSSDAKEVLARTTGADEVIRSARVVQRVVIDWGLAS